jgi:hypothetical protein
MHGSRILITYFMVIFSLLGLHFGPACLAVLMYSTYMLYIVFMFRIKFPSYYYLCLDCLALNIYFPTSKKIDLTSSNDLMDFKVHDTSKKMDLTSSNDLMDFIVHNTSRPSSPPLAVQEL